MMRSALVLLAGLILAAGCGGKSLTTEPDARASSSSCSTGCDGVLHVPPQDQVNSAIMAARDAIRADVENGGLSARKTPDWNSGPRVDWQACSFYVSNGYYYDSYGNKVVGGCAAGMTDYAAGRIVIATNDSSRTIALVKWEAANYFLTAIGHNELCDQWQSGHSM